MAERVVSVTLRAKIDEYKRGMQEAANETRAVGTEAQKLSQTKQALETVGRTSLAMGSAVAVGIGSAVAKFADFQQAMSYVAATGEDAAKNIDALRQAALDAGASTVFTATESANAIENLAKAGLSSSQILGGALTGSLDLAAAGGLGVADAAGIAATTLQQFKLRGGDASHVADLLAAGAGKAMGDVTDMAQALNQGGLVASQFGLSVEETTGTLAAFAQSGLLGSDAGTSFRTMLLRLANPTDEVKDLMKELGINAYDASGKFIGMAGLAGQLQKSLGGLTEEQRNANLALIFGQDAIRGANVLYAEGAEGIRKWTNDVNDQGYAAEVAAKRLDNLKGDVEQLSGATETALINMGAAADGPGRFFVQVLTSIVDSFNEMPAAGQQAVFWIGAAGAAAGIAAGAWLLLVPKVAEYKTAIADLGPTAQKTDRIMSGLGRTLGVLAAAGAGVAIINQLSSALAEKLGPSAEETANRVKTATSAVGLFDAALKERGLQNSSKAAADSVSGLGKALDAISKQTWFSGPIMGIAGDIQASLGTIGEQLGELAKTDLSSAQSQFRRLADETGLTRDQQIQLINAMPEFKKQLTAQASAANQAATDETLLSIAMGDGKVATDQAVESSKSAAQAYQDTADQASGLNDQIQNLIDSINEANGVGQDAVSANLDYQDALAKVDETIQKAKDGADGYSLTMDTSTQAGRDNTNMLVDLAKQAQDAADKQFALDGNTQAYRKSLEDGRQALIDRATDLTGNGDAARELADQIFRIPSETQWKVIADTATANRQVTDFLNKWNGVQIRAEMFLDSSGGNRAAAASAARYTAQAQAYLNANGNESGGLYERGVRAFENGGFPSGIYPGGAEIHKFAERTLPWEAYISPKPGKRAENIGIWQETGRRLGVSSAPATVSLEGGRITGRLALDADGFVSLIDGRIQVADAKSDLSLSQGWKVR